MYAVSMSMTSPIEVSAVYPYSRCERQLELRQNVDCDRTAIIAHSRHVKQICGRPESISLMAAEYETIWRYQAV